MFAHSCVVIQQLLRSIKPKDKAIAFNSYLCHVITVYKQLEQYLT